MTVSGRMAGDMFRASVKAWLAANFPPSQAGKDYLGYRIDPELGLADADYMLWKARMADKGWGVPTWPTCYGGGGLNSAEAAVLAEEMALVGASSPIGGMGVMMFGPTLLEYGTDEQKAQHLPPIARGELQWCQGFSEPAAGSDLAALQAQCLDQGDHWLVNGQKLWTSGAHHSDWCFALVRTDTSRKQGGITFLIIDMTSVGVDVRPIQLISGISHFCEVFFNDVRVPKENLVGTVNGGWAIAKRLLQHERASLSGGKDVEPDLIAMAKERVGVDDDGHIVDADLRTRLIAHSMRRQAYGLTLQRMTAAVRQGRTSAQAASILKNLGAECTQVGAELALEIMGHDGLGWAGDAYAEADLEATRFWLYSRAFSIYGGSHEVQANIVAKHVLDLN